MPQIISRRHVGRRRHEWIGSGSGSKHSLGTTSASTSSWSSVASNGTNQVSRKPTITSLPTAYETNQVVRAIQDRILELSDSKCSSSESYLHDSAGVQMSRTQSFGWGQYVDVTHNDKTAVYERQTQKVKQDNFLAKKNASGGWFGLFK